MPEQHNIPEDFISKLTRIIGAHISDEQFGVSELAREAGMSRSNLLRRVKKLTELSVSRFIRQERLKYAMELLLESSSNVSEVAYLSGFGSTSYFIKCFREQYGYPPGEAAGRQAEKAAPVQDSNGRQHQLAAIMFTDIQGYTALMQQDEAKAVAFRNRHREVFNACIEKFGGKVLQYYGDGTLSTFGSANMAVKCAIEMQLLFRKEPAIPVRIGIHTGDIIFTDDDIIGDGVNVASRIESLAVSGSVFISEKVFDEVKNQPGIKTMSVGNFELKNVKRPMEVYAVINPGLVVPKKYRLQEGSKASPVRNAKIIARTKRASVMWVAALFIVAVATYAIYQYQENRGGNAILPDRHQAGRKSIAVLPFINDSNDSSNVYIINGLMESILNNLQKIDDLRVISRTSVEKFRNTPKLIPELARELGVDYFVEGSGQKIGDRIMLSIQLIEAPVDRHLWSQQYNRQTSDIFKLQAEVAKNIADKIQVIVTPAEAERINRPPTENAMAYDFFLKGQDMLHREKRETLPEAIFYYTRALEHDDRFALAYANIAIAYYYLDIFQSEKKYTDSIEKYAEAAVLNDPQLANSLIAKALACINKKAYPEAVPYLEKALEYNPNSTFVINMLSDFYTTFMPDTEKYLRYALQGIGLDIASRDSVTASFVYLHVSNAFVQAGFIDEAEQYINRSLQYNPDNLYSEYVKAYVLYAKNRNLPQTRRLLLEALQKDTSRLDILQEVGKICYYMRDYQSAYRYYKRYNEIRESRHLDLYPGEDAKIALVYAKMGMAGASRKYLDKYRTYAENDNSIYKHLSLAVYHAYNGNKLQAIEHLRQFARQDHYQYWIVLFLNIDPLIDNIKNLPEYKLVFKQIEDKFWQRHYALKNNLRDRGLI